jgi:hypothetical protein
MSEAVGSVHDGTTRSRSLQQSVVPPTALARFLVFHCDFVVSDTTAMFSSPLVQQDGVAHAARELFVPRSISHQRAFAMMVMGSR